MKTNHNNSAQVVELIDTLVELTNKSSKDDQYKCFCNSCGKDIDDIQVSGTIYASEVVINDKKNVLMVGMDGIYNVLSWLIEQDIDISTLTWQIIPTDTLIPSPATCSNCGEDTASKPMNKNLH